MSLLRTERLSVSLMPPRVGVSAVPLLLGLPLRKAAPKRARLEPATPDWRSAVESLAAWLEERSPRGASASVVLSNRFVRFALVPWSDEAVRPAEQMALAAACLEPRYGDMAGWTVRLDGGEYGRPRLACAVETALLEALREVFAKAGVRGTAVRPAFVAAWNRYGGELPQEADAAFVTMESQTLVVGARRGGAWHSVRAVGVPDAAAVAGLLEREALLQGFGTAPPAWLVAPGAASRELAAGTRLRVLDGREPDAALALAGWAGPR